MIYLFWYYGKLSLENNFFREYKCVFLKVRGNFLCGKEGIGSSIWMNENIRERKIIGVIVVSAIRDRERIEYFGEKKLR